MEKPLTIIFIGRSASGKGTQLTLLKEYIEQKLKGETFSFMMGDTFRDFMKDSGYAQEKIRTILNSGNLAPNLITNSLFVSGLLHGLKENQSLLVEGIPRSISQADAVKEILAFYGRADAIIIDVSVTSLEASNRMMLRKRPDDTEEGIKSRFAFYDREVVPAIEHMKAHSGFRYIEIDGMPTIPEIHKNILSQLGI